MKNNFDRYVTVTFCDDIRQEVGNKLSFIGCYQGEELYVQAVPSTLPKLCAFVSVVTPKSRPFKSVSIRVLRDEVEVAKLEVREDGLLNVPPKTDDASTRWSINTAMMFAPFVIEKPDSLRVMVTTEEGEIIGPRLTIKVQAAQDEPMQVQELVKSAAKRRSTSRRSATTH